MSRNREDGGAGRETVRTAVRLAAAALCLLSAPAAAPGRTRTLLCLAAALLAGADTVLEAVRKILRGRLLDESFLMTAASAGAFLIGRAEEGAAVMVLFRTGELFVSAAARRSGRSVRALLELRPDTATALRDGEERTIRAGEIRKGDLLLVRPGGRIPADGTVLSGVTTLDLAPLTGESVPVRKAEGDSVPAGAVNLSGAVTIRASARAEDSVAARIPALVARAEARKAEAEHFITKFARIYTPAVVGAAALLALAPPLCGFGPFRVWARRALTFLVVSCPCALVVSVPLVFCGSLGAASRRGILVKGDCVLDALSRADTVVFDKTGTVTEGGFTVAAVHPSSVPEEDLLDLAAVAECRSTHPAALSILRAHAGPVDAGRLGEVTERAGLGVEAEVDGVRCAVGSRALMDAAGAPWKACRLTGTVVHVAAGRDYLGHIVIRDAVKREARRAVAELRALGIRRTVMLTGDGRETAEAAAREAGIAEFRAGLLPDGKAEAVGALQRGGARVAAVGDGINDAPVLAVSDVGIAMGVLGSDAAVEAADIVITDDNLLKLPEAVRIARRARRIAAENIAAACGIKALILLLGAAGKAGLGAAVFGDVGVLILCVLNALRSLLPVRGARGRKTGEAVARPRENGL